MKAAPLLPQPDQPLLSNADHQRAVGARLRRLAAALDLSLVEMAGVMGVSKQGLNGWLNGLGYPNDYAVYRLCRAYRVNYDYLYLGDWSQLPAAVAAKLEPAFAQALEGLAPDLVGGEKQKVA